MRLNLKNYYFAFVTVLVLAIGLLLPAKLALLVVTGFFAGYTLINPKKALIALFIYFPARSILVEINEGLKLAGDAAIIVLLLIVIFQAIKRKEWASIVKLNVFEWAFIVYCLFGSIVAYTTGVSIAAIIFQIRAFAVMYLLYYIVKRLNITKADVITFIWVSIGTATIIGIHGLIEKISLRTWLLPQAWEEMWLSPTNFIRIYGMVGNPNSLALYISFVIILTVYLLQEASGKLRYILYGFTSFFMGILLLTYSRGTWLALLISGVFYLLLSRNWKVTKQLFIAGVMGTLLVYLPTLGAVNLVASNFGGGESAIDGKGERGELVGRLKKTFEEDELTRSAETGRIFFVKKGLEVFRDYPITGSGFATFGDSATLVYDSPIYPDYNIRSVIHEGFNFYTDNQYIQIIAQTGTIGVILFAVFLLSMLVFIWKRRKEDIALGNFMVALWFATCLCGLYYNIWENKFYTLFFWPLLGIYAMKDRGFLARK